MPSQPNYPSGKEIREQARRLWAQIEEYYAIWGHYPWDAKGRVQRREYQYEPSEKQKAEDRAGYISARAQLARERERVREYEELGAYGGFEQRAAEAVSQVRRDTPQRVVNFGEVYHESLDENDELDGEGWVVVDHATFGPAISGRQGRSQMEMGPFASANPSCADPQIQDRVHEWIEQRRREDFANHRRPLGTSYLHYDDKPPCDTCEHNLQQQASFEKIFIDLFLPQRSDESAGRYSGARYQRSFAPRARVAPLNSRGAVDPAVILRTFAEEIRKLETERLKIIDKVNELMRKAHQLQLNGKSTASIGNAINAQMERMRTVGERLRLLKARSYDIKWRWPK